MQRDHLEVLPIARQPQRELARLLARRDFAAGSALHRRALKALDDAHHATFAEGYQRLLANEDGAVFTETAVDF